MFKHLMTDPIAALDYLKDYLPSRVIYLVDLNTVTIEKKLICLSRSTSQHVRYSTFDYQRYIKLYLCGNRIINYYRNKNSVIFFSKKFYFSCSQGKNSVILA
ncbi:Rpn family recombination-promoting nuclease/putative transposase [Candidatus Orientia mediorientalis]|uniref:Rpn family recombination-promoting nuclease/putative transposase n=1 Tax=Candidatus Orientia mediorientalis TaxID=911112 RepID=UPI00351D11E0